MTVAELIKELREMHPDLPVKKGSWSPYYQGDEAGEEYSDWTATDIPHLQRLRLIGDRAASDGEVSGGHTYEAVIL